MNITRVQQNPRNKVRTSFAHYNHLILINRSSRKKIQVQGLHDLLNLPMPSSPSRTPFLSPPLFFVLFVISKKISLGESRSRNIATLADVATRHMTSTSRLWNVAKLRLSSPQISFFKSPHSFQMPPVSPEMYKKISDIRR